MSMTRLKNNQVIGKQIGYIKHFPTKEFMEKLNNKKKFTIDFELKKTYDRVPGQLTPKALKKKGIPNVILNLHKNCMGRS